MISILPTTLTLMKCCQTWYVILHFISYLTPNHTPSHNTLTTRPLIIPSHTTLLHPLITIPSHNTHLRHLPTGGTVADHHIPSLTLPLTSPLCHQTLAQAPVTQHPHTPSHIPHSHSQRPNATGDTVADNRRGDRGVGHICMHIRR